MIRYILKIYLEEVKYEDMKYKFENSVNVILFLMFCLVLITISLSNCSGYCQESIDKTNLRQTEIDSANVDSIHN